MSVHSALVSGVFRWTDSHDKPSRIRRVDAPWENPMSFVLSAGHTFDVASCLGVGPPIFTPLPFAEPGEVLMWIPDGMSIRVIRESRIGKRFMSQSHWYDMFRWSHDSEPSGLYRIRIPVPGSSMKSYRHQLRYLRHDQRVAPVALVAAALLCLRVQEQPDALGADWTRCAEYTTATHPVAVQWHNGKLRVLMEWVCIAYAHAWISSVTSP